MLHYGHLRLLKRAKALGDYLIVGLSTDEFNGVKGKDCVLTYEERRKTLLLIPYIDRIIREENWEQKPLDIKKNSVDIFVMGDDWKGKFDVLKRLCKVIYLPRTKHVSTTELKRRISSFTGD